MADAHMLLPQSTGNELVVETFGSWDFGYKNSHSIELLLVALFSIAFITSLLFIVVALFHSCLKYINSLRKKRRYENVSQEFARLNSQYMKGSDSVTSVLVQSELIRLQGEKTAPKKLNNNDYDLLV